MPCEPAGQPLDTACTIGVSRGAARVNQRTQLARRLQVTHCTSVSYLAPISVSLARSLFSLLQCTFLLTVLLIVRVQEVHEDPYRARVSPFPVENLLAHL